MCMIGGYGVLACDQAIQAVRSVLHGVNGISKIEAVGSLDGMRDFVHHQTSNSHFG